MRGSMGSPRARMRVSQAGSEAEEGLASVDGVEGAISRGRGEAERERMGEEEATTCIVVGCWFEGGTSAVVERRLERLRALLEEEGVATPCSSSSEGTSTSPFTPAAD